jgi:hypothetical protein
MSPSIEVPFTPAERDEAIQLAYDAAGFLDADGDPDPRKLAEAITERVLKHYASKKADRIGVALRREKLMADLFKTVPGPSDYSRQANPDLAKEVYEALLRDVGSVTSPNTNSLVQKLVGNSNLVLCTIPLSGGKMRDGFYVTDSWGCIEEDYAPSYRSRAFSASERYGAQMALVAQRLPQHASKAKREFDTGMQVALQAGVNALAPALAAAKSSENGGGSDDQAQ